MKLCHSGFGDPVSSSLRLESIVYEHFCSENISIFSKEIPGPLFYRVIIQKEGLVRDLNPGPLAP